MVAYAFFSAVKFFNGKSHLRKYLTHVTVYGTVTYGMQGLLVLDSGLMLGHMRCQPSPAVTDVASCHSASHPPLGVNKAICFMGTRVGALRATGEASGRLNRHEENRGISYAVA